MEDKQNWALHLVNGIKEDTPIKQYMDLDYLLQMLETNHYYVSRKYTFEDALEGVFPTNRVFPVTAVGENIPLLNQNKMLMSVLIIDINPFVMIDEIILSPFIDARAANKLAEFITAGYRIDNVKQSKIIIK